MSAAAHPGRRPSRGFTLVEIVIVTALLGIAAVGIVSMQGNIFQGQSALSSLQESSQLMQACGEQVLAVRKVNGFSAVNTTSFGTTKCGGLAPPSGKSTPTAVVTSYTGTACPGAVACKLVTITHGTVTQALTVFLVPY